MKKIIFIFCLFVTLQSYSQVDSLQLKKIEESRFGMASRVIKNNFLAIPGDFNEMGHSVSKDWGTTGKYALGLLGLVALDKYTTEFWHNYVEPAIQYKIPDPAPIKNNIPWLHGNDAYITYPLIGLYTGSLITKNEKGQIAATNAFRSMAYSFVISHLALKAIFARNRPYREGYIVDGINRNHWSYTKDHWDFGNFHPIYPGSVQNGTAFPSLHATAFFAVAKVIQMEYDNYLLPYTFMAGVFLADIRSHNHWVSDLVFGGIIGTIIGRSVVLSSRKLKAKQEGGLSKFEHKKFKLDKRLMPSITGQSVGFHLVASF